mmetsp:Transcript_135269/g.201167  ORF Transcript_135269/g.201167 Transcript_135269/m.201167 type:complete len:365 (+) Transcript_135269:2-1096(+)
MCIVQGNRVICQLPKLELETTKSDTKLVLGKRSQLEINSEDPVLIVSPPKKQCIIGSNNVLENTNGKSNTEVINLSDQLEEEVPLTEKQAARIEAMKHSHLIQAARIGHSNKIKEIAETHPHLLDRPQIGYTALHYASFYNHRGAVETLIEVGASIDIKSESGITPLAWAVDRGNSNLVGYLLECEADPSIANREGMTPLHTAVKNKNYTMVETLLSINTETEEWTKVNARTNLGCTPAYFAAFNGSLDILQILYEYGAQFNISSSVNVAPLHRAVSQGNVDVVKYLLECNANVDKQDDNGRTALHTAAFGGNKALVEALLIAKPKILRDINERTPLDLANIRKWTTIAEILEEYLSTCIDDWM